jgi:hypothetical protein
VRVRVGLAPEVGDDPDGWTPPVSERRRGKRKGRRALQPGPGGVAGPREGKERREERPPGWAVRERGELAGLGLKGEREREKEKEKWAGPN